MTLFSYHKYNDFILIQEIYTQKYTACTKDEANRIADSNLQSDGTSYANGLTQADRCDCVEPTKTWSANVVTGSKNCSSSSQLISTVPYTLLYTNPCGSSKSVTVEVGGRPNDIVGDVSASRTVTVPSGSGSISGSLSLPQDCLCSSAYATGYGSGNC